MAYMDKWWGERTGEGKVRKMKRPYVVVEEAGRGRVREWVGGPERGLEPEISFGLPAQIREHVPHHTA